MCGRYAASRSPEDLILEYEATDATAGEYGGPDFNVAPTDPVLAVRTRTRDGQRQLSLARWGLVPSWAADRRGAASRINARVETVQHVPAFRSAFARRRCLVPADGWYEWVRRSDGPGKQAYFMSPYDGRGVAFAGLWESWGESRLLTVTILTTGAVGRLAQVHHRMPLVLPRSRYADWLDPAYPDATRLLEPTSEALVERLESRPVGPRVGAVANDGPDLVQRQDDGAAWALF